MPLGSVLDEAGDALGLSLEEGQKSPSKSVKHATVTAPTASSQQRKRAPPPLGALGYLLAAVQKLLHVCIHCRGTWQLTLTASLALYYFQSEVLLDDLRESANLPGAARECTKACGVVCALPDSAFVSSMDVGVTYRDISPPPSNRKRYARAGAVDVSSVRLKTHPSETWWINPRRQSTFCQWSWSQSLNDDPLAGPNLQYMADSHLGTPLQRRWMDYPGKYYNTTWDEVQNWLSLEHDPVLLLHLRYRQMLYLGGQSSRGYALIAILVVIYTLLRVRNARYGSLYYILQLDSFMAAGARSAWRVRWVALISLCMPASVAVTLFYSKASALLYVKLVVTYSILGMSFYSLINQASPVGPSLRLNARRNEPTRIPCMRWWHTSELTVSQVFALFLLSERRLDQVKSQNKYELLQRHINTALLEAMPIEELKRIKAIWQVDEELAKHNKTRKMTMRKLTSHKSIPPASQSEGGAGGSLKASERESLGDSLSLTSLGEDTPEGLLDTVRYSTMSGARSTDSGGNAGTGSITGGTQKRKPRRQPQRGSIKKSGNSDSSEGENSDADDGDGSRGSLQFDSQAGGDEVTEFVALGDSSNSAMDLDAGEHSKLSSGSGSGQKSPRSPRRLSGSAARQGGKKASDAWTLELDATSSSVPTHPPGTDNTKAPPIKLDAVPQSPPKLPSTKNVAVQLSTAAAKPPPPGDATSQRSQHVHSCREWIFVLGNTVMGMSQYWILTASMVLTCNKLLTLLIKYSVGVAFVMKCTCSCDANGDTIQRCYEKELDRERLAWLHLLWPMTIPLLVVFGCIVFKLHFDLQRFSGTRYGTLQYVIACELRKRTRTNRVLAVATTICTSCITGSLLVVTYLQAKKYQQEAQLYAFLIDVMQQLVAGFTMCTETGYLTPLAQRDVPDIVLPFRWWDSGNNVISQLMCLAALSNDEIGRLKDAQPAKVRSHGLPMRFVTYLSVYDMLRIKHHLRRQDVMNPFRISVEDSVLPTIHAVAAYLNKTVAFGRVTTDTLRVAPAPEVVADNFMMTDFLEEEETPADHELFQLSQTLVLRSQVKGQAMV